MGVVIQFRLADKRKASTLVISELVEKMSPESTGTTAFRILPEQVTQTLDEAAGLYRVDIPAVVNSSGIPMTISFWIYQGEAVVTQTTIGEERPNFVKAMKRAEAKQRRKQRRKQKQKQDEGSSSL